MTALRKRAARIRLLLTDVDGVLTDGKIYHFVDTRGRLVELKGANTQDGVGFYLLDQAGIMTGCISGRRSAGFAERAKMMRLRFIVQGTVAKVPAFEKILKKAGVSAEETAFVGDDLPDLPLIRRAGLGVATANARPEIKRAAHFVTKARGGEGALREVCELLLKSRGAWKRAIAPYFR